MSKMKNVLVTGGAGFIGSHLVSMLVSQGHNIIVVDDLSTGSLQNVHPGVTFINQAVESIESKILEDVELVFHLASVSGETISFHSPKACFLKNVHAGYNLIRCCIEANVKKIVFTSSMAVYGNRRTPPFTEEMSCDPTDPYGVSKQAVEYLLRSYGELGFYDWNILRLHNVYGPGMNLKDPFRGVVGIFVSQVLQRKPISIYGDGEQTRSFTFISDIIPSLVRTGLDDNINAQILNLGLDAPTSLNNVAKAVFSVLNEKENVQYFPNRLGEAKYAYPTSKRAREIFGDFIKTEFDLGIRSTIEWAKTKDDYLFDSNKLNFDLELGQSPIPWFRN